MSCISDELIQKYIDNETSEKENAIIHAHVMECSVCAKKIEERKVISSSLKELINSGKSSIEVPEFNSDTELHTTKITTNKRWIIYSVAAACIIAAILIFYPKQEESVELIFSYSIESEYNANSPLSEQEMVLEIIDSEGKLITF